MLKHALCLNNYCRGARERLLQSVLDGLRSPELSPKSSYVQHSGWIHTGMYWPEPDCEGEGAREDDGEDGGKGGKCSQRSERVMWACEQQRYPYLEVRNSLIPKSGRGVFARRRLVENEVVCTMLGQIRTMQCRARDAHHPLNFDIQFDDYHPEPDREYGLRLFPHTFAAIINSTYTPPPSTPPHTYKPNCIFVLHPHFQQYSKHYLTAGEWPSGAYCVRVAKGHTIETGQEWLLNYKWRKTLHTKDLS